VYSPAGSFFERFARQNGKDMDNYPAFPRGIFHSISLAKPGLTMVANS
jgi:hypothetical protein